MAAAVYVTVFPLCTTMSCLSHFMDGSNVGLIILEDICRLDSGTGSVYCSYIPGVYLSVVVLCGGRQLIGSVMLSSFPYFHCHYERWRLARPAHRGFAFNLLPGFVLQPPNMEQTLTSVQLSVSLSGLDFIFLPSSSAVDQFCRFIRLPKKWRKIYAKYMSGVIVVVKQVTHMDNIGNGEITFGSRWNSVSE